MQNNEQSQSSFYLKQLADNAKTTQNIVTDVKSILVVLSSRAMAFDADGLKYKIKSAYPNAKIFLETTAGKPFKSDRSPSYVDLVIDFTGPGEMQGMFYARKLRAKARVAVGRNSGFFRKGSYDRVYEEKSAMPNYFKIDFFERERLVQREVMGLAGISLAANSSPTEDMSFSIALDLPPLKKH